MSGGVNVGSDWWTKRAYSGRFGHIISRSAVPLISIGRRVKRTGSGPLQAQTSVWLAAFAVDSRDGIHSNVGDHRRPRLHPDPDQNAEEVGHLLYFRDCVEDAEAKGKGRRTAGSSHLVVRQI
jgi:hypothetical protein